MVEKKDSPKRDFHEDGKTEREKKSRGKTRLKARPTRSESENLGVENGNSTVLSADSPNTPTLPPVQENPEVERPGILTQAQIAAIQNDYRVGFTPKQIKTVTGLSLATIYKHTQGIEQQQQPIASEENKKSNTTTPDPPASSLSQPSAQPTAPPPKIVEVIDSNETDTGRQSNPEPNGDGYGGYGTFSRESRRPPLPVADSETIAELLMLFGGDMRRRGFSSFPDYFENFVIPQFERVEFWMSHVPGRTSDEKGRNLKRYLWIASKQFELQKDYAEYETVEGANNGTGLKEGES